MKPNLEVYREKRDFSETPEPKGKIEKSTKKLHFVIQYHQARTKHYDFRLEWKGVLLSWAVPKGLPLETKDKHLAIRTEDHPLSYRRFEGVIPQGQYGGGTVRIFDEGYWKPNGKVDADLKKGEMKFVLQGKRFSGGFALIRMKEENQWLIIKEKDFSASEHSLETGKSVKKRNPFSAPSVELALPEEQIPTGKDWIYEIKYDGYRILAEAEYGEVKLLSRNHRDYTETFPTIAERLRKISKNRSMILDGEMVCADKEGKSSFPALQEAIKRKDTSTATYVVFDLLSLNGEDLRDRSLRVRKNKLKDLLKGEEQEVLYSKEFRRGAALFEKAQELGLEGIIAKDITSSYTGKRSGNWRKIKCRKSDEFVIGGYQSSTKAGRSIRSLLLGKYQGNRLVYCGKVGSGIRASADRELFAQLKKIRVLRSPFDTALPAGTDRNFVRPIFVAEVEFAEYTSGGRVRQGTFKGIREDKSFKDLKGEPSVPEIPLTNPDKIVFPEKKIRKIDIAEYYQKVAFRMLPYIENRPMSVLRCSQGIGHPFFKKHPEKEKSGIRVFKESGKAYFAIETSEGLLGEVQMGSVEFHIQGNRLDRKTSPDYMVFDLDPDAGLPLSRVRQAAKDLKKILRRFHLTSFLKTSGGKGYHIVVPFAETRNWESFSDFARRIVLLMEDRYPDLYTSSLSKKSRKGRIFIDWMRNKKGATSAAPYSLRARKSASVSMPIFWKELDSIAPDGIDIDAALQRLNRDPWKNFNAVKKKQKLL